MPSREQISDAAEQILQNLEIGLDTQKGPLADLILAFHVELVSRNSAVADRLLAMTGPRPADALFPEEVELIAQQLSVSRPQGRPANGTATFYVNLDPATEIKIAQGTRIADSTGSLVYRVDTDVVVPASQLNSLWNATARRFEIQAPISSVRSGADVEVPPFRLTRILDPLPLVSGVTNTERIVSVSVDALSSESLLALSEQRLQGTNRYNVASLELFPTSIDPQAQGAMAITAADEDLFSWRTDRAAVDLYVIGETLAENSIELVVDSGTDFALPEGPIVQVSSVLLEGEPVAFELVADPTQLAGSTRAQSSIRLAAEPAAGSSLEITYLYNSLLTTVQRAVTSRGRDNLIATDVLVYAARPRNLEITLEARTTASEQVLQDVILEYFNRPRFGATFSPDAFRAFLVNEQLLASSVLLTTFRDATLYTDAVETISLSRVEYPVLSPENLRVSTQ